MTQEHATFTTIAGLLQLTDEELEQLPAQDLLRACLAYRSLVLALLGYEPTPYVSLTERVVALDLLYIAAQEQLAGQSEQRTFDVKQVSERLGVAPTAVRKAYEQLAAQGFAHIDERRFRGNDRKQPPLPL